MKKNRMKKAALVCAGLVVLLHVMGVRAEEYAAGSETGIVFREAYEDGGKDKSGEEENNKKSTDKNTQEISSGGSVSTEEPAATKKSLPQTGEKNTADKAAGYLLAGIASAGVLLVKKRG